MRAALRGERRGDESANYDSEEKTVAHSGLVSVVRELLES
jgi:hypothetical protein